MDPIDHFVADVEAAQAQAALRTLESLGYTYHGGEQWKPPLGPVPDLTKLSPEQELRWVLQAIADPENQPSQYGTVTIAHMEAYAAEAVKQERGDTARLQTLLDNLEDDGYGFWLSEWCVKQGDKRPSLDELRVFLDKPHQEDQP